MADEAGILMARIEALAAISEEPGMLVRRSFTEELSRANELVAGWMRDAGLAVRLDAVCNLIGRYECGIPGARTLILGSHLDSVRDAGRFDGPLGVTAALACAERLAREGRTLPFAVEVIAFTDEEGLRFRNSYLGSSAIAGIFDPVWLEAADEQGITMREAMRASGGDPDHIASCRYRPEDVLGYCEAHIEQGPVLEAAGLPVGVVTGIIGRDRLTVGFGGTAGHAGTVPMALRHDALCGAAELVLEVEHTGRDIDGLVATVGQLGVSPGAGNVIPGHATLSLDLRHRSDEVRLAATQRLYERASAIAARRGLTLEWQIVQRGPAMPCAPALVEALERSIAALGYPVQRLASGAGHDAVPMSQITQAAMLFVRCKDGISHSPAESITTEDAGAAVEVLYRFVLDCAARESDAG